jgi:hypothetical protein
MSDPIKFKTVFYFTIVFVLHSGFSFGQKKSVAEILSCTLKTDTIIRWTAREDTTKFTYVIQQFKWNRWVNWDTIQSLNQKDSVSYEVKVSGYLHSGENKFRIKANNITPKTILSQPVLFTNKEYDIFQLQGHFPYYQTHPVTFSKNTYYELYDKNGNKLKQDYGKSFYIKDLPKDIYWLCYDNKITEIIP